MKKRNLLLLGLLPFTLIACDKTSNTSSSSKNDVTSSTSSSSSSSEFISSESSSNKDTSSSSSIAENPHFAKLKTALKYVALQDKIQIDSTSGQFSIDTKGNMKESSEESLDDEGDSSSSSSAVEEKTTTFDAAISLSDVTSKLAVKGLKALNVNNIAMSYSINNDLSLKYTISDGTDTKNQDLSKEDVGLKLFLKSQYLYADLDNEGLREVISTILSDMGASFSMSAIPNYVKYQLDLSDITIDQLPINNVEDADIDSTVDVFASLYDSMGSSLGDLITFRDDEDYTYLDVSLTTTILRLLPPVYKSYAEGQLDSTASDYQAQLKKIDSQYKMMKNFTDHTEINKFKISVGYTTTGIKSINSDIDTSTTNLDVSADDLSDTTSEMISDSSLHFDTLNIKEKADAIISYDTSVTVEEPNSKHLYVDLSTLLPM